MGALEGCDIHIGAVVCDGPSLNEKFFRIDKIPWNYKVSADGVMYWTLNTQRYTDLLPLGYTQPYQDCPN